MNELTTAKRLPPELVGVGSKDLLECAKELERLTGGYMIDLAVARHGKDERQIEWAQNKVNNYRKWAAMLHELAKHCNIRR